MFTLLIKPDGRDPYELECTSRDVNRWEKRGKGRSAAQLDSGASMGALYEISHLAAQREGVYDGTLTDWEDSVDIEQVAKADPDEDSGPTHEGR